jgi:hypothetical protein
VGEPVFAETQPGEPRMRTERMVVERDHVAPALRFLPNLPRGVASSGCPV